MAKAKQTGKKLNEAEKGQYRAKVAELRAMIEQGGLTAEEVEMLEEDIVWIEGELSKG